MGRKKSKTKLGGIFLFALSGLLALLNTESVFAAPEPPSEPDRYTSVVVEYTSYKWWLLRWEDSEVVCEMNIEHEGKPTLDEVYIDCGEALYTAWLEQEACPPEIISRKPTECPGYYLHYSSSIPKEREIALALPPPVVWITLENCFSENGTNRCDLPPTLVLHGDEPLSGEKILRINGELDGESFSCDSALCELPLSETDEEGVALSFWADSSYGDSSYLFDAYIRVIYAEDEDTNEHFWYVDVLSAQWRGEANASCSESWDAFPPVGGVPEWLSTPEDVADLESDLPYNYLAGNLISRNIVDASHCADFGIDAYGQATPCGLDAAEPAMIEWQNRFDALIMKASEETSIPATLIKRLFARESQFWPGVFNAGDDVGLGQLTENGADIAFLWNPVFFEEFCPLVFESDECDGGYLDLNEAQQERIRGALVYSVNAMKDDAPLGVDLAQADYSVSIFANTLLGSCEQTGTVVFNNTAQSPGALTSYEDLWKFTLVNYNAGAGCLSLALGETIGNNQEINWENLSSNLTVVCMGAKDYVEDISQ